MNTFGSIGSIPTQKMSREDDEEQRLLSNISGTVQKRSNIHTPSLIEQPIDSYNPKEKKSLFTTIKARKSSLILAFIIVLVLLVLIYYFRSTKKTAEKDFKETLDHPVLEVATEEKTLDTEEAKKPNSEELQLIQKQLDDGKKEIELLKKENDMKQSQLEQLDVILKERQQQLILKERQQRLEGGRNMTRPMPKNPTVHPPPKNGYEYMTIEDYKADLELDNTETKQKREKVRNAFKHAFNGYSKVWGKDEYKPLSQRFHNWADSDGFGMTIIDSLDTIVIMGLTEEYNKSLDWVKSSLKSFATVKGSISVFETNIRVVGGFLSAYELTGETIFLNKAIEVADLLMPAFDSPTGVPYSMINMRTKEKSVFSWADNCAILSEFGTLQLEFRRLSELTGDNKYNQKVTIIMDKMAQSKPDGGLFPLKYNIFGGSWCTNHISMGAMGDSFFEYLLKQWLMNRGTKAAERYRDLYLDTVDGIFGKLLFKTPRGFTYIAEYKNGPIHKVDHLACFAAGMLALGGYFNVSKPGRISNDKQVNQGAEFTKTCYQTYQETATGLGPDSFHINQGGGLQPSSSNYMLRPETVESIFIMWRVTGDEKYREWGWKIFESIEEFCKIESGGYSGLANVNSRAKQFDDFQQSFFLAETLKYLYLLFSPNHIIPLDKFVFNTEAHPIRVTKTEH